MALGSGYDYGSNNDNNKKQYRSPEVYSAYYTSNKEGVDPSALSYSFWNGMLKISIAPMLKNPTEKKIWDTKNSGTVFLTHRLARILYHEAKKVLAGEQMNGGVRSGDEGLISFSNGKEVGSDNHCLIIRNVQGDGTITATYVYEFREGFHNGICNFRADTSAFDRSFYDNIEIDEFLSVLDQFSTQMSKVTAYTVVDELKYEHSRINTKIGLVAEALGVEFKGGDNSGGKSGKNSSYFDGGGNNSSSSKPAKSTRQTTLEDIGMNPPEDD